MKILKIAASTATFAAVALGAAACGGSAPADASVEDFCAAVQSGDVDKVKETGTPESIPDDARAGFELALDSDLGPDATQEEMDKVTADFSDEENANLDAFGSYYVQTCVPGLPSGIPSVDLPTEIPSDLMPSGLPTDLGDIPTEMPDMPDMPDMPTP